MMIASTTGGVLGQSGVKRIENRVDGLTDGGEDGHCDCWCL
jgi:hypothetical protein